MKVKFTDKLKNLIFAFDDQPANCTSPNFGQSFRKTEESPSLFSTGASYTSSSRYKPTMSYEFRPSNPTKDDFQKIDSKLAQLQQKISLQSKQSYLPLRTPKFQKDSQINKNKIRRIMFQLNSDYFNQSDRLCYINKPIARLDQSLFSTKMISQSLVDNSPTKKRALQKIKIDLSDLSELTNSNPIGKKPHTNLTRSSLMNNPKAKQIIGLHLNLYPKQEMKMNNKPKPMSQFREYYTEGNKIGSSIFFNKQK